MSNLNFEVRAGDSGVTPFEDRERFKHDISSKVGVIGIWLYNLRSTTIRILNFSTAVS
jgi:hypothetical protein